ncbi:ATP-binding protein [bacterium]|nr:ATP-binding protein [bacterium]
MKRDFTRLLRSRVQEPLNFMQVVVGPRQVGKTTGVQQVIEEWSGSKLFVTADTSQVLDAEWLERQWNNARNLPGPVLFVVDEVQKVSRWNEVVKVLFDQDRAERRLRVVLLGSASLQLATGLSETLAGRYERIYVPHWSFQECHEAFHWTLDEYLCFGGYPAPAEIISDVHRWQEYMRYSIIEPILTRDIVGLAEIRKPALFRQVFELTTYLPAQEISYQKIVGQLQDRGTLATVKHYLELLEQVFLLSLLPKYSGSDLLRRSTSPKILPLCPALAHVYTSPEQPHRDRNWRGRLLEVAVGAELRRRYDRVSYWRKRHHEVDFVIHEPGRPVFGIEVKSGSMRKGAGLKAFFREHDQAITKVIDGANIEEFLLGRDVMEL